MFTEVFSSVTEVEKTSHRHVQSICQSLSRFTKASWHKDTSSLRNERSGKKSRLQCERNKEQLSHSCKSGLPEEWWDCAMECCCYLRNEHDKTADGMTAFEKIHGQSLDGPSILFRSLVEYIPITAKDMSRVHQFGTKTNERNITGAFPRSGRGWSGELDLMIADVEELQESEASETQVERLKKARSIRERTLRISVCKPNSKTSQSSKTVLASRGKS